MSGRENPESKSCDFIGTCVYRDQCLCQGDAAQRCAIQDRVGVVFFVDSATHPYCKAKMTYGSSMVCLCPALTTPKRPDREA